MDEKLIPKIDFNEYSKDKYLLDLGNYEIKEENGKIFAVLKKPRYPKTYKECCDVLSIPPYYNLRYHTYEHGFNEYATSDSLIALQDKLNAFGKLFICHNAYWKIAGEQMRLGKPWEPDWTNSGQDRYIIRTSYEIWHFGKTQYGYKIFLVFPTEEMRDVFYENFKDLIKQCKELL